MDLFGHDILMLIGGFAIFCAIFTTGVFLQVKIISTLKSDQAMAWEIDVAHSIAMIVIFKSVLILETINYLQPTFDDFFGKWYCDLLLFELLLGFFEILFHSMYISFYKYIFIVHSESVGNPFYGDFYQNLTLNLTPTNSTYSIGLERRWVRVK